jgi:hypothetical protein
LLVPGCSDATLRTIRPPPVVELGQSHERSRTLPA